MSAAGLHSPAPSSELGRAGRFSRAPHLSPLPGTASPCHTNPCHGGDGTPGEIRARESSQPGRVRPALMSPGLSPASGTRWGQVSIIPQNAFTPVGAEGRTRRGWAGDMAGTACPCPQGAPSSAQDMPMSPSLGTRGHSCLCLATDTVPSVATLGSDVAVHLSVSSQPEFLPFLGICAAGNYAKIPRAGPGACSIPCHLHHSPGDGHSAGMESIPAT